MDDAKDLIDQLCTLAGTIMEDTSPDALAIPPSWDEYPKKVDRIRAAGDDISRLGNAALVVLRRQE